MDPQVFFFIKVVVRIALLAGAALLVVWFYVRLTRKPVPAVESEGNKLLLTLRLQAYERTVLLLERITPGNLVLRIQSPDMNAIQLQAALIRAIREEFEYNLSQQLYISVFAWELVKNAKEETIKLINLAAGKVPENAPSAEVIRILLEMVLEKDKLPVQLAIEQLKKEVQQYF
jgi:hypothetical protein